MQSKDTRNKGSPSHRNSLELIEGQVSDPDDGIRNA